MRMHRWIGAFTVAAAISLSACGGSEGAGGAEIGSADGISPTEGQEKVGGPGEGSQAVGSPSAQDQGTTVNDTTPHRPGAPATP
ncbi:hypothetical protein [Longimicrobium sp.]|uniref:hypothetical protein n=1 Tax=Longimicrobium sp. TaxID=2029185 RepID=UPI002E3180D7|nr:hypothetical protein [Longimicrobium sp.]HEX6036481.1 hypothetical protein [Longimicrobium sp.]